MAKRLLQSLALPVKINDVEHDVHICIGIAHYPSHGESVLELLHAADSALQQALDHGQNTITIYAKNYYGRTVSQAK